MCLQTYLYTVQITTYYMKRNFMPRSRTILEWPRFVLSLNLACCADVCVCFFSTLANSAKTKTSADRATYWVPIWRRNCLLGQSLFTFQILVRDATAVYQAINNLKSSSTKRFKLHFEVIIRLMRVYATVIATKPQFHVTSSLKVYMKWKLMIKELYL